MPTRKTRADRKGAQSPARSAARPRPCGQGHTIKPSLGYCRVCYDADRKAAKERGRAEAEADRLAAMAQITPLPASFQLRDFSGRIVGVFRAGRKPRRGRR